MINTAKSLRRVKLDGAGKFALCKWIDTRKDWIEEHTPSQEAAALVAARDLDLPVNASHIRYATKSIGWQWPGNRATAQRAVRAAKVKETSKVSGLESEIQLLKSKMERIERQAKLTHERSDAMRGGLAKRIDTIEADIISKIRDDIESLNRSTVDLYSTTQQVSDRLEKIEIERAGE